MCSTSTPKLKPLGSKASTSTPGFKAAYSEYTPMLAPMSQNLAPGSKPSIHASVSGSSVWKRSTALAVNALRN